jgi:hypothetical protein
VGAEAQPGETLVRTAAAALAAPSTRAGATAAEPRAGGGPAASEAGLESAGAAPAFNLEGLIRDERGIRIAPEIDD